MLGPGRRTMNEPCRGVDALEGYLRGYQTLSGGLHTPDIKAKRVATIRQVHGNVHLGLLEPCRDFPHGALVIAVIGQRSSRQRQEGVSQNLKHQTMAAAWTQFAGTAPLRGQDGVKRKALVPIRLRRPLPFSIE